MGYLLGVDLGTSFTAAALSRDDHLELVSLGTRSLEIPSVVYLDPDQGLLIGEAAERRGLTDPTRLAREFKRRLGDPAPILIAGTPFSAEGLMAAVLKSVVAEVTDRQGEPPTHVTLTRPANWGPFKCELFGHVPVLADAGPFSTTTEPEAAAAHFASTTRVAPGGIVAVYDLGGGTFDAAVLRKTDQGFEILGVPEGIEHLGGADFDDAVFDHVRRVLGSTFTDLNPLDPTVRAAAARLRAECVQAKEDLSRNTETTIPVSLPGIQTEVRLTRQEFEDLIRPALMGTVESLRRALRSAKITPDQVAATVLAGGSSRIPLVAELIGSELRLPVAVGTHPKHAVALGAALIATHDAGQTPTDPATGSMATIGSPVTRMTTEHWETDRVDPVTATRPAVPPPAGGLTFDPPDAGRPKRRFGAPVFASLAVAVVVAAAVTLVVLHPWRGSTTAGTGGPSTTSTGATSASGTATSQVSTDTPTSDTPSSRTGTATSSGTSTPTTDGSALLATLPGIPNGVSCTATTLDFIGAFLDPTTVSSGIDGDPAPKGEMGVGMRNAAQLAVAAFNVRNPACPVTLTVLTTQQDTTQAASAAAKAAADPAVVGVIAGTFPADVTAMGPALNAASLPFVVVASLSSGLNSTHWPAFNQIIGDRLAQAPTAATYLTQTVHAKKVALIDDGTVYGTTTTSRVSAGLGGAKALAASLPAAPTTVPPAGEDFSALVQKITISKADTVYFAGQPSRGGYLLKQLRAAGFAGNFLMAETLTQPTFLTTAGADASEGAMFTCSCAPPSASAPFEAAYRASFGDGPPTWAPEAYDATTIFLQGLAAGVTDRSAMTQYVRSFSGAGISKPLLSFDANGYVSGHPTWFYRIENGAPVPVGFLS